MQWSVVNFQQVSNSERIDAEYFSSAYLSNADAIMLNNFNVLEDVAYVTDGNHLSIADNYSKTNGIRYLRGQDISEDMRIIDANPVYISEDLFASLKRSHIYKNDILVSIVGTIGSIGLVTNDVERLVANCKIGIIRSNKEEIEPYYLYTFLISKFGQSQIKRSVRGAVQTGVILPDLKKHLIIRFSDKLETEIATLAERSHIVFETSTKSSKNAETLLLKELGFENWQPKKQLSFVANYAEVEDANRFDADYFQPHYKELLERISEQQVKLHNFGEIVQLRDKNYQPIAEKEYRYIELSNIGANGEITGFSKEFGENLPSRARRIVRKGDVIISSIEGSIDSVALISDKEDGALCSTGFYVAHSEIFNPETLLVLLKSIIGQLQLKRGCNGTILTAISKDELNKLKLPEINKATQEQLKQFVQQMYDDRDASKHLLETAKRAVEIAIEEDEDAAFRFIEAGIK